MLLIEAINAFVEDVAGWKRNETPKSYRAKLRRLLEVFPHRSLKTISLEDLNKLKRGMMGRYYAGIKSRCNPHSFRHAFARDCLNNKADLSQVSQLLGHSTIAITAAYYARWADHELKRVHHLVSPGAKLKHLG